MKIVSLGYSNTPSFNDPEAWLDRISFYTGILEELAKQHEVESIEQIDYTGQLKRNGVLYHFLNFKESKFPFKLHKYVKKIKPDIVFVNGFIFPLQIIQLKRSLGNNTKIIVINQGEKPFTGLKKWLQRMADSYVNAYLFASTEFAEPWTKNGNIKDQKKIREALHGSSVFVAGDKAGARSALSITGSPVFLWIGRLDANKDPLVVVKTFISFLQQQPAASLYMIYHTEELLNKVQTLIKNDEKAIKAFRLIGKVSHKNLQAWFDSADFMISGSHHEGGGMAVCEAMSCGCIPILTDIISFRKMTGPGKCGILYQPGNGADLLKALIKTTQMNIQEERKKVLHQFEEELSFKAIAKKINKLITSLYAQ